MKYNNLNLSFKFFTDVVEFNVQIKFSNYWLIKELIFWACIGRMFHQSSSLRPDTNVPQGCDTLLHNGSMKQ